MVKAIHLASFYRVLLCRAWYAMQSMALLSVHPSFCPWHWGIVIAYIGILSTLISLGS